MLRCARRALSACDVGVIDGGSIRGNFKLTSDSQDIDELAKMKGYLSARKFASAISIGSRLAMQYPRNRKVWRVLADALSLSGDLDASIEARKNLLSLGSTEPADFYDLSRHALYLGKNHEVVEWCTQGLRICEHENNTYYLNPLRFLLSVALINNKEYSTGKDVACRLPAGYSVNLRGAGVKSKDDLIAECTEGLRKAQIKVFKFD